MAKAARGAAVESGLFLGQTGHIQPRHGPRGDALADMGQVLLHVGLMQRNQHGGVEFVSRRAKPPQRLHHAAKLIVQDLAHWCGRQGRARGTQGSFGLAGRLQRGAKIDCGLCHVRFQPQGGALALHGVGLFAGPYPRDAKVEPSGTSGNFGALRAQPEFVQRGAVRLSSRFATVASFAGLPRDDVVALTTAQAAVLTSSQVAGLTTAVFSQMEA